MCPTSITEAIPHPTRVSAINIGNRTRSGRCSSSTPAVFAQPHPVPLPRRAAAVRRPHRANDYHREHTPTTRLPGFDDANHTRATHAAAAAATRAERALDILGDQVPDNLTAVAALRITHREVSLEALGQMLNPPMTKDAVAGRIRRLLALADNTARRTGIPDTTTALTPNTLTRP